MCVCVCIVGFYSAPGLSECRPCTPGTFQPSAGQSSYQPCSRGLICRSDSIVVFIMTVHQWFLTGRKFPPGGKYQHITGKISFWWQISRVAKTVSEIALNSGPDNELPITVCFTDINVLCDFMLLFATNSCMFVVSIAWNIDIWYYTELWINPMKTT